MSNCQIVAKNLDGKETAPILSPKSLCIYFLSVFLLVYLFLSFLLFSITSSIVNLSLFPLSYSPLIITPLWWGPYCVSQSLLNLAYYTHHNCSTFGYVLQLIVFLRLQGCCRIAYLVGYMTSTSHRGNLFGLHTLSLSGTTAFLKS